MSALALKILSKGNTGDKQKLCLFFSSSYFWNCYLMNILDGRLRWKMIAGNCLCMSALALKILSEENTGDQKKLRLVSFPSYVWNFYLMKISDGCLRWK